MFDNVKLYVVNRYFPRYSAIKEGLNVSEINWDDLTTQDQNMESLSNKIIEIFRDCFFQQVIMENTRGRGANIPSLLQWRIQGGARGPGPPPREMLKV